ncbi:hypothetical protein [Prochlorococcus sp. MIT 1307]|uniref:hypothetical protein n=1 Tax=Prochlorococcus sp. MIT 1307 TaxID=3096219 RepID=UPI002A7498D6|nr:hypothetical protein [Prochlorococcus sp. MIT 1307]
MVRERIKELVDFATTESPYRDANKGWLTDDVYIEWGKSNEKNSLPGNEFANVSVYWKPINEILLILFIVVFLAVIFVFTSVSFAHGRFQTPLGIAQLEPERVEVSKEFVPVLQEQSNQLIASDLPFPASNEDDQQTDRKLELERAQKKSEFAAAALGGRSFKTSP